MIDPNKTNSDIEAGTSVSGAIIDAHAGVPGVGAGPDTLVLVMGTSSCHMLNSNSDRYVPTLPGVIAEVVQFVTSPLTALLLDFHLDGTVNEPKWRPQNLPKELFLITD